MQKGILLLAVVLGCFLSCAKEDSGGLDRVNENPTEENTPDVPSNEGSGEEKPYFTINISDTEFKIADDLGLTYFNDMSVGIIKKDSEGIELLTAALNFSVLLSGTALDNITAVSYAGVPAKMEGAANDSAIDHDYFGLGTVISTPSGILYGPYHGEWYSGEFFQSGVPAFYGSIGLASSRDRGRTFQKHGILVPDLYNRDSEHQAPDWGLGEPAITYNRDSTAVYLYYVDHNRFGRQVDITMVKFDAPGKEPDFDTPYFLMGNGQWTTEVIRSKHVVTHGNGIDTTFPQVQFNAFLDKYVMVYNVNAYSELINNLPATESGIYIRTSDDGIHWADEPIQLIRDYAIKFNDSFSYSWHPTLIYSDHDQDRGYLVYSKGSGTSPHYMVGREFQLGR